MGGLRCLVEAESEIEPDWIPASSRFGAQHQYEPMDYILAGRELTGLHRDPLIPTPTRSLPFQIQRPDLDHQRLLGHLQIQSSCTWRFLEKRQAGRFDGVVVVVVVGKGGLVKRCGVEVGIAHRARVVVVVVVNVKFRMIGLDAGEGLQCSHQGRGFWYMYPVATDSCAYCSWCANKEVVRPNLKRGNDNRKESRNTPRARVALTPFVHLKQSPILLEDVTFHSILCHPIINNKPFKGITLYCQILLRLAYAISTGHTSFESSP
jgi:hypothetical protein